MRDRHVGAARPAPRARASSASATRFVNESVIGTRFTGRIVERDDRRRPAGDRAGDHRPRVDHRRWASTCSTPTTRSRPASASVSHDVVVVGAGIVGAAVARELAVRGVAVTLLDRGAVSSGTTGLGEGNVLCSDKDAGPELELARAGLARLRRARGAPRRRREDPPQGRADRAPGRARPGQAERGASWSGWRSRGRGSSTRTRLRELEPELSGRPVRREPVPRRPAVRSARDHPCARRARRRTPAPRSARAARSMRSSLRAVCGWRAARAVAARAVVLAAGPWSAPLAAARRPRCCRSSRARASSCGSRRPSPGFLRHKVVDGSYLLSVTSAERGRQVSTVVETTWDGDVLVGSSRERCGFDTSVDPARQRRADRPGRAPVPAPCAARARSARGSASARGCPTTCRRSARRAQVPGLWLATGHEGAGVALGPVTGRLVAQLYAGEPPVVDPGAFDPDRFA